MQCSLRLLWDTLASSHKDKTHIMLCECESVQIFTGVVTKTDGNIRIWDAVNINTSKCRLFSPVPSDFLQVICFVLLPLHIISNCEPIDDLLVYMGILSCRCVCCYYSSGECLIQTGHSLQVMDSPYQFLSVPPFYTHTQTHHIPHHKY